jgi:hypothetical protein
MSSTLTEAEALKSAAYPKWVSVGSQGNEGLLCGQPLTPWLYCLLMSKRVQCAVWIRLLFPFFRPFKYITLNFFKAVCHTCNPSYAGGRDQEDCSSKPAQANSLRDPISKNTSHKKGWWSGSKCKPWVQAPIPHIKKLVHVPYKTTESIPPLGAPHAFGDLLPSSCQAALLGGHCLRP